MTDLLTLSQTIAEHLPPWRAKGWTAVYESDYYRIKHPAGPWLTLYVQRSPNKTQLNVCGAWSTAPGTEHNFEEWCRRIDAETTLKVKSGINLNPERPSHSLAKDIHRRLVADYLPLYQQGLEAKQSQLTALNDKEALLQQLAAELGVSVCGGSLTCHSFGAGLPNLWGEISVNSPTSLSVKLVGLTPEQWSRVLAVLLSPTPTPPPGDGSSTHP